MNNILKLLYKPIPAIEATNQSFLKERGLTINYGSVKKGGGFYTPAEVECFPVHGSWKKKKGKKGGQPVFCFVFSCTHLHAEPSWLIIFTE